MRLDKFISEAAGVSRTDAKKLIKAGRVCVNGVPAKKGEEKADEASDIVTLDGKQLKWREFVYLMMNKPEGVISATYDKKLPTVVGLLPDELRRFDVFPAGRLDIDTTGLLILTNDGDFAHRLTSPKKFVYKTYRAYLDAPADDDDKEAFAAGMDLGDFMAAPALLVIDTDDPRSVTVKIREGKFHQVKRMCEKVGKRVVKLERTAVGGLCMDASLGRGCVRELTNEEKELIFVSENIFP